VLTKIYKPQKKKHPDEVSRHYGWNTFFSISKKPLTIYFSRQTVYGDKSKSLFGNEPELEKNLNETSFYYESKQFELIIYSFGSVFKTDFGLISVDQTTVRAPNLFQENSVPLLSEVKTINQINLHIPKRDWSITLFYHQLLTKTDTDRKKLITYIRDIKGVIDLLYGSGKSDEVIDTINELQWTETQSLGMSFSFKF